ncbi:hypothetical protein SHAM105786_17005 [Shewanella amazonensis]
MFGNWGGWMLKLQFSPEHSMLNVGKPDCRGINGSSSVA